MEATLGYRSGPWVVRAGYAFTDVTFRTPFTLNSPDNPSADDQGQITVVAGNRLPGIPRHRALLSADYRRGRWSIGADVQAAAGQYLFGDEANLQPRTGAYVIANLRASAKLIGPLRLFGEVSNLFDRRYATYGTFSETGQVDLQEVPSASDSRSVSPGAPRRFNIGLKAEF